MRVRDVMVAAVLGACLVGGPAPVRAQQHTPKDLLQMARDSIGRDANWEGALPLIRRALDARPAPSREDRVWGLLLLAGYELYASNPSQAEQHFRSALELDPGIRVDSLAEYCSQCVPALDRVLREMTASSRRTTLEFRYAGGAPRGVQLLVDGSLWATTHNEVTPGWHRFVVSARGFRARDDSVLADPGVPQVVSVALEAAPMARLSVSSEPLAGFVFLDGDSLGETPVVERQVLAGSARLRIVVAGDATPIDQSVVLPAGEVTNLTSLHSHGALRSPSPASQHADSLYRELAFDSALVRYRALAAGAAGPAVLAAERARAAARAAVIYLALGKSRNDQSRLDSARTHAQWAARLDPEFRAAAGEYGPEAAGMLDRLRQSQLVLRVAAADDSAVVRAQGGFFRVRVVASHASMLRFSVAAADGRTLQRDSLPVNGPVLVDWSPRGQDGRFVPDGRYVLRFDARDDAGESAETTEQMVTVSRVPVDTTATPARPLLTTPLERSHPGDGLSILAGLALGAAAFALPEALQHGEIKASAGRDPVAAVVSGTAVVVGIAGYIGGTRLRPSAAGIAHNQTILDAYERQVREITRANQELRDNADLLVVVGRGPQ